VRLSYVGDGGWGDDRFHRGCYRLYSRGNQDVVDACDLTRTALGLVEHLNREQIEQAIAQERWSVRMMWALASQHDVVLNRQVSLSFSYVQGALRKKIDADRKEACTQVKRVETVIDAWVQRDAKLFGLSY
jgi:hypothetical protein